MIRRYYTESYKDNKIILKGVFIILTGGKKKCKDKKKGEI